MNVVPYDLAYRGPRLRTIEELYRQYAPYRQTAGPR